MSLKVVHDGSGLGDVLENCCMCRKPTPWWYGKGYRNVALCEACAETTSATKLPTKRQWLDNERNLERAMEAARISMSGSWKTNSKG